MNVGKWVISLLICSAANANSAVFDYYHDARCDKHPDITPKVALTLRAARAHYSAWLLASAVYGCTQASTKKQVLAYVAWNNQELTKPYCQWDAKTASRKRLAIEKAIKKDCGKAFYDDI